MNFTTLCYIEKENKYLMLHRTSKKKDGNKDKWIGVGGHFEKGESPEDCLLREVKEETGLDISIQDGFRQAVEYFPKPNVRKQVVYFLGEAQSVEFKMQEEEISRIIWTDIRKAYHMVTFKNDKNLILVAGKRLR